MSNYLACLCLFVCFWCPGIWESGGKQEEGGLSGPYLASLTQGQHWVPWSLTSILAHLLKNGRIHPPYMSPLRPGRSRFARNDGPQASGPTWSVRLWSIIMTVALVSKATPQRTQTVSESEGAGFGAAPQCRGGGRGQRKGRSGWGTCGTTPVSQQECDFASRSTQMFLQGVFFPFRTDIQRSYSSVTWELYGDF